MIENDTTQDNHSRHRTVAHDRGAHSDDERLHQRRDSPMGEQPTLREPMFLSSEDLHDLTGYKSARKQAEWLTGNGYHFDLRADGRPNVLLAQLRERQRCGAKMPANRERPDFSWMRRSPTAAGR